MAEKKGVNPLFLGLGLVAGAVGALLLSKKENRKKAASLVKKAGTAGGDGLEVILKRAKEALTDLDAFNKQASLDKPKKALAKKKA